MFDKNFFLNKIFHQRDLEIGQKITNPTTNYFRKKYSHRNVQISEILVPPKIENISIEFRGISGDMGRNKSTTEYHRPSHISTRHSYF